EPTRTYLRRVPRWWAGKDPAAKSQTSRSAANPGGGHQGARQSSEPPTVRPWAPVALSRSPATANWPIARCRRRS
ncbi:hypothetical protein E2P62_15440, partial [Xanthomonas perforans]